MKKIFRVLCLLLLCTALHAQQPQTANPLTGTNAKWTNGVAPGYYPTKGSGLTLNVGPGTCFNTSNARVTYAGGTLTMTASQTNYVWLDSACALQQNTTGYPSSGSISAVTTVVAGGSSITSYTDDRTYTKPTVASSSGSGSVPKCADSSGSGTVQLCTTSPTFTPSAGDCIVYTTTTANTGAGLTLNVNSLGAKSVVKWQTSATLAANDVRAGVQVLTCYDGTNWELHTIGNAPAAGLSGSGTSGNPAAWTGSTSLGNSTGHNQVLPLLCADSSGSGTAQSCTTSPTFTPGAGDCIVYTTTTANTGAGLTLNVNSLGAKSAAKWQGTTTLAANDVLASKQVPACYDGTNWEFTTIGNAPSGGGLTTIVGPTDILDWIMSGSTATATKQDQLDDYVFIGPPSGSFLTPTVQQGKSCIFGVPGSGATNTFTCTFDSGAATGDLFWIHLTGNDQGGGCTGSPFNETISSVTFSDNVGNTYTTIDSSVSQDNYYYDIYSKNVTGGSVTFTLVVHASTVTNTCAAISMTEIAGLDTSSPLDQHSYTGSGGPPLITTTTANAIVLGGATVGDLVSLSTIGWQTAIPSQNLSGAGMTTMTVYNDLTSIGTYTPVINGISTGGRYFTVSFKAATSSGASGVPDFGPIRFSALTKNAFPGLTGVVPAQTSGDTQVDLHVGTPIEALSVTSAYAGNNTASTLAVSSTTSDSSYHCWIAVNCHSATSVATVIPAILYTDTSNTAETLTGGTATCTTLGTNSTSNNEWPVYVHSSSTLYLKTTIANSPTYDVHAVCELANTQ